MNEYEAAELQVAYVTRLNNYTDLVHWVERLKTVTEVDGPVEKPDHDKDGFTWLHHLTVHPGLSDQECAALISALAEKRLLELELAGQFKDVNGQNPIFYTARDGKLCTLKMLVKHAKMSPLIQDKLVGQTALFYACAKGQYDIVKWVISNFRNARSPERVWWDLLDNNGETALFYAIRDGHLNVVKFLVGAGCSVTVTNKNGATPLGLAKGLKPSPARNTLVSFLEESCSEADIEKLSASFTAKRSKEVAHKRRRLPVSVFCKDFEGSRRVPETCQAKELSEIWKVDPNLLLPGYDAILMAERNFRLEEFSPDRKYLLDDFKKVWIPPYLDFLRGCEIQDDLKPMAEVGIFQTITQRLRDLHYRAPQTLLADVDHVTKTRLEARTRKDLLVKFYNFMCHGLESTPQPNGEREHAESLKTQTGANRHIKCIIVLIKDMQHQKKVFGKVIRPVRRKIKEVMTESGMW